MMSGLSAASIPLKYGKPPPVRKPGIAGIAGGGIAGGGIAGRGCIAGTEEENAFGKWEEGSGKWLSTALALALMALFLASLVASLFTVSITAVVAAEAMAVASVLMSAIPSLAT